jgi:hypothetical protein
MCAPHFTRNPFSNFTQNAFESQIRLKLSEFCGRVANNQIIFLSAIRKSYILLLIIINSIFRMFWHNVNTQISAYQPFQRRLCCYYNNLIRLLVCLSLSNAQTHTHTHSHTVHTGHMYYGNGITGFDYSYVLEYFCINLEFSILSFSIIIVML